MVNKATWIKWLRPVSGLVEQGASERRTGSQIGLTGEEQGGPPGAPFRWIETRNIDRNLLVILAIAADVIYRLGLPLGNLGRRPAKDPRGRPKAFKGDDFEARNPAP